MDARVVAVEERPYGSELAAAASATDAAITVVDAVDFDDAGSLIVGEEVIAYTLADEDAGELTLATPLASSYDEADPVYLHPLTVERVAWLRLTDEDEELEARVPHALYDRLAEGIREEGDGESVEADYLGDELVVVDVLGRPPAVDGSYIAPGTIPGEAITDGDPPASSPTPVAVGGPTYFALTWAGVANNDPVEYEVHVSAADDFTPDSSTHYATTRGTIAFVKTLADLTPFEYETDYYFKLVAADDDGLAAAGAQDTAQLVQINSPDIAVDAITAVHILAEAITAEKLEALLILGTTIIAGTLEGGRIELGGGTGMMEGMIGIHAVDADGETITFMVDAETGQVYLRGRLDFGVGSRLLGEDIIELFEAGSTGFQTPQRVQSASGRTASGGASLVAVSWPSPTTLGNLNVLVVSGWDTDGTPPTPTTPTGWTLIVDVAGEQQFLRIYRANDGSVRSGAQSVTLGDTCYAVAHLFEFSGLEVGDPDVEATASGSDDSAESGTTATTTQAEAYALAVLVTRDDVVGTVISHAAAFDQTPTDGFEQLAGQFAVEVVGSPLAQSRARHRQHVHAKALTATGTVSTSDGMTEAMGWLGAVAVFKAKAAGVETPDTDRVRLYAKAIDDVARLHVMHEDGGESSVALGTEGEVFRFEYVTVTFDLTSLAAHTGASGTVSIPGLAVGDLCFFIGIASGISPQIIFYTRPPVCTVAGEIGFAVFNAHTSLIDEGTDTYYFLVIHRS